MSVTESDRVLAAGIELVLEDGSTVHLRYGMRGLKRLEDDFGSILDVQLLLRGIDGAKPIFGPVLQILAAGLLGQASIDELDVKLHPAKLDSYVDAIADALEEAFPEPPDGEAGKAEAASAANGSGGPTGTTSPPSPAAEATPSSGT